MPNIRHLTFTQCVTQPLILELHRQIDDHTNQKAILEKALVIREKMDVADPLKEDVKSLENELTQLCLRPDWDSIHLICEDSSLVTRERNLDKLPKIKPTVEKVADFIKWARPAPYLIIRVTHSGIPIERSNI